MAENAMSRRGFIAAGGVGALGVSLAAKSAFADDAAPSAGTTVSYSHVDTIDWDAEYDVIVVGYGSAGSVASINAAENGAKVLLTEKAPKGDEGGNTRYCEQWFCVPKTYEDGLDFFRAMAKGFDTATDEVIDFMARGSQEIGDWLLSHGAETFADGLTPALEGTSLDNVTYDEQQAWYYTLPDGSLSESEFPIWPDGTPNEGRVCEFMCMDGPDNQEKKYWHFLVNNIESREDSIEVWLDSPAKHLIQDPFNKTILGVQIEHEGELLNVRALNGVILTCGSYEANQEMFENYTQLPLAYPIGSTYNTGDGITMALEVGADLWHMDTLSGPWICAKLPGVDRCFSTTYCMQRITTEGNCINVGGNAKRFMDDSGLCKHGHVDYGGTWISQVTPDVMWAIMDSTARNGSGDIALVSDDDLFIADSIEELAAMIDLDVDTLCETVDNWNQICDDGVDPEFHRYDFTMKKIETAPFYACRLYPACVNCQGGPKRNTNCEVLDTAGNPIPNLYSAGELGSFWAGVYICGGNIAESVYTGLTAGANAAVPKDAPAPVELTVNA